MRATAWFAALANPWFDSLATRWRSGTARMRRSRDPSVDPLSTRIIWSTGQVCRVRLSRQRIASSPPFQLRIAALTVTD